VLLLRNVFGGLVGRFGERVGRLAAAGLFFGRRGFEAEEEGAVFVL
jgi:hypothetical protein